MIASEAMSKHEKTAVPIRRQQTPAINRRRLAPSQLSCQLCLHLKAILTSRRASLNGRHINPYMMGLTQELKQLKIVSQRSRSGGTEIFPTVISNRADCSGTQHSVKTITIVRQVSMSRTDMALDDDDDDDDDDGDVTEAELLVPGIT